MVATTEALASQRSAFRPLLSHKQNEVEFVGAGSNRSHAAWTEFMPVRVAERRHHQESGHWQLYVIKKGHPFEMSFSIKVAMTYSPTNLCSTIGAVGLNFSVRDGKRWIPNAINRLNKGLIP